MSEASTTDGHRPYGTYAVVVVAAGALYIGWDMFWFLCDDAFIAFRYVSNSALGYGYTWNPPPFRPVDGYTSFLWVALLDAVWRTTGVEPPQSSNALALLFAYGQLILTTTMVLKLPLHPPLQRLRTPLVGLVLIGVLSNRTFLAWTSSGLETSMFNFFVLAWVYCTLWVDRAEREWVLGVSGLAVLITMTRPDGLLFVMATAFLVALRWVEVGRPGRRVLTRAMPATVALLIYLLWKWVKYGSFLPNTYYAKHAAVWPDAGARYLASFVVEYALWVWLVVASSACVIALRGWLRSSGVLQRGSWRRAWADPRQVPALFDGCHRAVSLATLAGHLGYYTFIVGGDHFEYRVYSHLVPLILVSFVWALSRLRWRARVAIPALSGAILLSLPIPWTHWAHTHQLESRRETVLLKHPVARHLPRWLRWYGRVFDSLQFYLIDRMICIRHQEHKIFLEHKKLVMPSREDGLAISPDGFPVLIDPEAGWAGWALPYGMHIDAFGLNDYFIARNTETLFKAHRMAHSRIPPPGYLKAFRSNVKNIEGKWRVRKRRVPMTAEEIGGIEARYLVWLDNLE